METELQLKEKRKKIVEGLEKAYEKMVEFKRYKQTPLIVMREGEIVEIPWDQIPPTTKYIDNTPE